MIDKQKFKEAIISNRTRIYCILDGAAIPNLPKRLFDMKPPHFPLLQGDLTPDMVHVAPYLVQLKPHNAFTKWILEEGYGKNWGIFVHSISPKLEMRRHFKSLITVQSEDGRPLLFRFYDPRVFRKFLPICDAEQVTAFFGTVDTFFVESEDHETLISYKNETGELKLREIELAPRE